MKKSDKKNLLCRFCQIANKNLSAFIVFEDEHTLAFLDYRPLFHGHCLLIHKQHYATLTELPQASIQVFFSNVQLLSQAIQNALCAEGSFIAINNIVSQSVPHLHVHIVPRNKGDGLKGFFWPRHAYQNAAEMKKIQTLIKHSLTKLKKA